MKLCIFTLTFISYLFCLCTFWCAISTVLLIFNFTLQYQLMCQQFWQQFMVIMNRISMVPVLILTTVWFANWQHLQIWWVVFNKHALGIDKLGPYVGSPSGNVHWVGMRGLWLYISKLQTQFNPIQSKIAVKQIITWRLGVTLGMTITLVNFLRSIFVPH